MNIIDTKIQGLKILEPKIFEDSRGKFIKTFTNDFFIENNLDINIKETYYSISHKDVIRGMHFQTPPYEHIKLVYVPAGKIIDVVLDIRKNSSTFREYFSCELSSENGKVLIIPKGLAHGFKSLEDNTNVTYMQTSCYVPNNDCGIRYDSFEFDWECISPKLSDRDKSFPTLKEFDTPFIFGKNS
ncbi:dTDP-4-dehydrorhamnose 3,5-epimerase family protein [Aliarcobacter cryaerophilus]|uniref:dTDP-4-dehydrorhamnose 3,5-epimerase family protein n=1 Tax=Aliarcobacter cryaerophilus TaxID=28198 RepID=UPI0021B586C7|nr:dTDP-4-dehydrorhamnose 3,5-epimerase family protein [Aliarcobacter cryaerophilus]MCT7489209.1 dTDP-4-dehydrorhamnose 3,5-epimerase family protein [Aliarcobacter cryaerophilus]MCT7539719.1 dTDP-4-dehydrorhamnose 3,5-epimerase family protein [Aliarcobacter cryaerophilus]